MSLFGIVVDSLENPGLVDRDRLPLQPLDDNSPLQETLLSGDCTTNTRLLGARAEQDFQAIPDEDISRISPSKRS